MGATPDRLELTVNGRPMTVEVLETTPLMQVLRHDLGLGGVRTGCAIGECGACTVLVGGRPVRSCITPVGEVGGDEIVTPEGLGTPDDPHPIQRTFIDAQAAQCGYCVNGMIMTVAGQARAQEPATEERLRGALDEHLCRCGTHLRLLEAARRALGLDAAAGTAPPASATHGSAVTTEAQPPAAPGDLPPAVAAHPRIEQWIELGDDGRIVVHAGKVELGQGIRTALAQIVATQLGVPTTAVEVLSTRTGREPDQWFTAGSLSIEDGGTALARAGAAFARAVRARAVQRLEVAPEDLEVTVEGVAIRGTDTRVTFAELLDDGPITGVIEPSDVPRWHGGDVGRSVARSDLAPKLTGAPAYLQDLRLDGMLHARVALPPSYDAQLTGVDLEGVRQLPGVVEVVHDGRLVIVVAERDDQAVRGVERLRRDLAWEGGSIDVPPDLASHLRSLPAEPFRVREDPEVDQRLAGPRSRRATYTTPYVSHGSMAPSAAAAVLERGHLTVWTHSQGVYPLRRELSVLLDIAEDQLTVQHQDGPGAYGMNGADDAAAFAAIAARAVPGRPVRVQLSIDDEFAWEPYGPAMVVDLAAALDHAGRLCAWRHHGVTDVHMARPNGSGDRLVASWLRDNGAERPWPGPAEGGARNGVPLYDIPALDVVADHVRGPLRTAALRCLGAFANIFATESFMDEMAEAAGSDPVEFRRDHLTDDRARAVLDLAVERAGWTPHVGPSGQGRGVALAHYKDSKAYVAQVVDVDVAPDSGRIRVRRVVLACDAGLVVNPDGLRNQLEGGTLQGLSRTLFEELHVGPSGVRERDWSTYPVLRFRDVPEVEVHVVDRPDLPPLGVGESATPPIAAAVANAVDDAVGIRLRDLPLTAARMERRLLEMDEQEAARVRL